MSQGENIHFVSDGQKSITLTIFAGKQNIEIIRCFVNPYKSPMQPQRLTLRPDERTALLKYLQQTIFSEEDTFCRSSAAEDMEREK